MKDVFMKVIINPETHKDLLGKKFICAYLNLNLNSGKKMLVNNIKEAKLKVIHRQIVKVEIIPGKRNYRETVYFNKEDRHGRNYESDWQEGGLFWLMNMNESVRYQYEEDMDALYYCGDIAEYYAEDRGQTDEEIRALLEKAVRTEVEKELECIAKELEFWKEKEEKLKNFIKK